MNSLWINAFLPLSLLTIPNHLLRHRLSAKLIFQGDGYGFRKRIGVIGIIVEDRQQVPQVNSLQFLTKSLSVEWDFLP